MGTAEPLEITRLGLRGKDQAGERGVISPKWVAKP